MTRHVHPATPLKSLPRALLRGGVAALVSVSSGLAASASQPPASQPWMDTSLTPVARSELLLAQMTSAEQMSLLHGHFAILPKAAPPGVLPSAGYFKGVPRLGVPPLTETDASLGVANAGRTPGPETALPSGLALASTWDTGLAYQDGAMIGHEARAMGFDIMLAGGVNLVRDPRNGRNFEYVGEDPLLAGMIAGASIKGIQSNHIVSTAKHYALNAQETGRHILDAVIDPDALRESDLLAFEIALEQGRPGSVMCGYNKVNGAYDCENAPLFSILKSDWKWKGWVMSDWGAVHSAASAALAGLDQESGEELDKEVYFGRPLKAAVAAGQVPAARVHDMVLRVLTGLFAAGVMDDRSAPGRIDDTADAAVSQRAAEQGLVLLKNQGGLLPLARTAHRIVVIGGRADVGVLSGGGSSQVVPQGSVIFKPPPGGPAFVNKVVYHPSSPLAAIRARAAGAQVVFDDGSDPARAAELARGADVTLVFATQWATEGQDVALTLPDRQDALVQAVVAANPRTVVVLETGGPVLMPWLERAPAVLEAWYPGSRGGEAIARVLFGEVDAAGRLPVSFPRSVEDLPRPKLPGEGVAQPEGFTFQSGPGFTVDYREGADVGYRWYEKTGAKPLFPFGYGLSYTRFRLGNLHVAGGADLTIGFDVTDTGDRAGVATPQVYVAGPGQTRRLVGWGRFALQPGETRHVEIKADPRLIARFDTAAHGWRVQAGAYRVVLGTSSADEAAVATADLSVRTLAP